MNRTATLICLALVLGGALLLAAGNQLAAPGSTFHVPTYVISLVGKYLCYAMLTLALDLVWGYAGILSAIEAQRYDTISTRARIGRLARVGILWNAWRYRAPAPDLSALGHGPRIVWEPNAVAKNTDSLIRLA